MRHRMRCACGGNLKQIDTLTWECSGCRSLYGISASALTCWSPNAGMSYGQQCEDFYESAEPVRACPQCGIFRVFGHSSYDSGSPPAKYCHNCGHKYL